MPLFKLDYRGQAEATATKAINCICKPGDVLFNIVMTRFTGLMELNGAFLHTDYILLRILSCFCFLYLWTTFSRPVYAFLNWDRKQRRAAKHHSETNTTSDFEAHWQVAGLAESEINAPSTQPDACRNLLWRLTVMTGSCNNKNTDQTGYVPVAC